MGFTYHSQALSFEAFRTKVEALDPDLPVAIANVDVDDFGTLNERDGDETGDRVLHAIEEALVTGLPANALVAHVKGDEWAVALPDALPEDLLIALDGVRRRIADDGPLKITGGVAGRPQHGLAVEELVAAADTGLVRAKQAGGNKIAIATDERMVLKSNYYTRPSLHRLAKLASRSGHTEAHFLREALDDLLVKYRDLV